jgi:hypothetical protein
MLSTFYHMAGTEKHMSAKGLDWLDKRFLPSATGYTLHIASLDIQVFSGLVISHERVEALVFFRRPSVPVEKRKSSGPFLGTRLLQNCGFPSRPRWGTWNMPCLCSPKIACSSAVSQRPRTDILGPTFQVSVFFLWVLWPEHQELLYIIELNTTEVEKCQATLLHVKLHFVYFGWYCGHHVHEP